MENILQLNRHYTMEDNVVYRTKIHWISNIIPLFFSALGIIALFIFLIAKGLVLFQAAALLLMFWGMKSLYKYIENRRTKIHVKPSQLTLITGVFSVNIYDISLNKYEGMRIYQSLLGRLLNYGTLVVSTGEISQSYTIADPLKLRQEIFKQVEKNINS